MTPLDLRRYRAERLLRRDFSTLRSKVLAIVRSQLRVKGIALDSADLEACYAHAWHGLYATVLGGEAIENPSAWLVLVTFRRAIDESRSAGRRRLGAESDGEGTLEERVVAPGHDLAAALDDRARLRQLFEGLRTHLSEREREAASLCYLQGFSRAEAAERMGIGEARMRKLMEGPGAGRPGVASKVGELLDTIKAGGWCEQQSSLMRAFAFGILDPDGERHELAVAHCRECPACRAHVASLRGLAAVLPLPLLSPLALAGASATGTTPTGSGSAATSASGARPSEVTASGPAGGAQAANAGASSATRLGAAVPRALGRAGGALWSDLAGSLAVKLAVIALTMLGAGYAVLDSRAHGSAGRPANRPAPATRPEAGKQLTQDLLPVLGTVTHRGRSTRLSSAARTRFPRSSRASHVVGEIGSREFGPERVPIERVPASTPSQTRSPGGASRVAREFGIE